MNLGQMSEETVGCESRPFCLESHAVPACLVTPAGAAFSLVTNAQSAVS